MPPFSEARIIPHNAAGHSINLRGGDTVADTDGFSIPGSETDNQSACDHLVTE